jgi:F plasmid transfer operon, TraF, protein
MSFCRQRRRSAGSRASVLISTLIVFAGPRAVVLGQTAESVGVRAQGMAGAFTAVADDATATWWNPAGLGAWNSSGLAGGSYANAILDFGTHQEPRTDRDPSGNAVSARRVDSRGFAVAYPALGLSYYRLSISEIQPPAPTGATGATRQDPGTADVRLRSLILNQLGTTVGQSFGRHLVIGSTLKLLRGSVGAAASSNTTASLDAAAGLDGDGETHVGLDVGALASFGLVRAGVMVRNVHETTFGSGADTVTLGRQARAGLALVSGARGGSGRFSAALDADLTTATTVVGEERRVAAGAEGWLLGRRLGVRGGVSASTAGARRSSVSGGFSAAVSRGTYVDAEVTGGADDARQGWGLALRLTF